MLSVQKVYNFSFILRLILNILFFVINKFYKLPIIGNFLFLFLIDIIDYKHIPFLLTKNKLFFNNNLTNFLIKNNLRFYYDVVDKICDIVSYVLFINLLDLNVNKKFYNYIILYRLFGVFLLMINKNYYNIVFFPDLFKELIGFELFVNKFNNVNKYSIIIIKFMFEYVKLKYIDKLI